MTSSASNSLQNREDKRLCEPPCVWCFCGSLSRVIHRLNGSVIPQGEKCRVGTPRNLDSGADMWLAPCTVWLAGDRESHGVTLQRLASVTSVGAVLPGWEPLTY